MGLDQQFEICQCYLDKTEVWTFGEEKPFPIYTVVCGRGRALGEPLNCGFNDFCKDCPRRYICATERKVDTLRILKGKEM